MSETTGSRTTAGRQRGLAWLALLAAGVIALALAGRSGQHASLSRALGWSLVASVGVSLLLGVLGRRLVAVLALVLGLGVGLVAALGEGHWGLYAAAALAFAGALAQLVGAPRWSTSARRYGRAGVTSAPQTDLEVWKAFDAGMDPTSDEFGDSLEPRETSPVATRKPGTAPSGPDQEDQ